MTTNELQKSAEIVYAGIDEQYNKTEVELQTARNRLRKLEEVKRAASAQGDRSENAEYHAAITEINDCSVLISQLQGLISAYKEFKRLSLRDTPEIGIGSALHITDKRNRIPSGYWVIVPEALSDLERFALSVESPVGKTILSQAKIIQESLSKNGEALIDLTHNGIQCQYIIRR